jgi:TRAP-type C4-dicarboxylate transport system permease small subunit
MSTLAGRFADVIKVTAGVLLVVVASAMVVVILGRYVGFATAWADEVARIAFVWSAGLGAASGSYRGLNFAIPLIASRREGRTKQVIETGIAAAVIVLCASLLSATTQSLPVAHLARMPALGVTGAWFHAAIAAFALLTALFMALRIVDLWRAPVTQAAG